MSEFITTIEASEILGCSLRTIQRYVKRNTLKSKVIAGKTVIRKESVEKLKPIINNDKKESPDNGKIVAEIANESLGSKIKSPNIIIPDGYILIDKETLESLRSQIKTLTVSMGDMQLTQKLLIQKGLNLKEVQNGDNDDTAQGENLSDDKKGITHTIPIGTEVPMADFYMTEKPKQKIQNLGLWIALGTATIILIALIFLTFFTNK